MTTQPTNAGHPAPYRAARKVVVVSQHPEQRLPDEVMDFADVVFVASMSRAYSEIKRVAPDFVVLYHAADEFDAYRVLSMLKLDKETSMIPIVTCEASPDADTAEEFVQRAPDAKGWLAPMSMN